MKTEKKATSYRVSVEALGLLAKLAIKLGINKAGVIETAVRLLAKREGVK